MTTPAPPGSLFYLAGQPLRLGPELGRGGEATVHALADDPRRAAKLYHSFDPARARKLELMTAAAPEDPGRQAGHVAIAWPEALVRDAEGRVTGFVMPRLDARRVVPLHQLYHPGSRRRRAPGIGWRYLVRIGRNLAAIVAALHEAGYVIGDLNESNILVDERALVTLVDLDSLQVRGDDEVFRCQVGKAEYTPPELLGASFREVTRHPRHDAYGLAVLLFQLLLEGVHPFAGVFRGDGEPPALEENIAARRSPFLGSLLLAPPPFAPPFGLLPRELRGGMRRALGGRPGRRPGARWWQAALERLEGNLTSCPAAATHHYPRHLPRCPWCERREALGLDAYPDGEAIPGPGSPPLPAAPAPLPVFRDSPSAFLRRYPLTSALLLAAMLIPASYGAARLWLLAETRGWPFAARLGTGAAAALLPAATLLLGVYLKVRGSATGTFLLTGAERLVRALLGASFLSLGASALVGALSGRGSPLTGDWLLLPSLWLLAFFLLLRLQRNRGP